MNKTDMQLVHDIMVSGRKSLTVIRINTGNRFTGGKEYTVERENLPNGGRGLAMTIVDDQGIKATFTPEMAKDFTFNSGTPISKADQLMAKQMADVDTLNYAANLRCARVRRSSRMTL